MKNILKAYLLVGVFLFSGCGSDEAAREFNLTVNGGSGSGKHKEGEQVVIAAAEPEAGKEFDRWSGDAQLVDQPTNKNANVAMPGRDAEVTATYKEIDLGEPVAIAIDPTTEYQVIDGFGFFGAQDVWWASASSIWSDAWGEKVISDLGITIWRNEYFPPSTPEAGQDADWTKQKPVVEGLKAKADKYDVDLKFIFTVWSPPADLKWQSNFTWPGDENATRSEGPVSTKNGGTLNPNKYGEYASWLKDGIQLYKDAGVDVYAFSLQNELMFTQSFHSCTYTFEWYNDLIKAVVPSVKASYPNVKIFGAENMLDLEGANVNWPYFYHANLKSDSEAAAGIDILAVHGYLDGVAPSSGSGLAERWTNHRVQFSEPMQKRTWMTETSGYSDSWTGDATLPGALNLGMDIHAALFYGNASAWVWWQGSQSDAIGSYNLMKGDVVGKKYYVSKHFYRYIRPGAVRVKALTDNADVFVTAYKHAGKNTFTVVLINSGAATKRVVLQGTSLPAEFNMYRTNSGTENCKSIEVVTSSKGYSFVLPANTIVTLQAGGDQL